MKSFAGSAVLLSLALVGCGEPQAFFRLDSQEQTRVTYAIFATQILPASLDGDKTPEGEDILDDAVSELIILAGDQPNLCDIVTDTVESGGTPPEFAELTLAFVIARKFELESPGSGFVPGDSVVANETGTLLATFKRGSPSFREVTEEEGLIRVEDIDENFLQAKTAVSAFTPIEDGLRSSLDFALNVETPEVCPALLGLPRIPLVGLQGQL